MRHNQTTSFFFNHHVRLQHSSVRASRMDHQVRVGECLLQRLNHLRSPSPWMTGHWRTSPRVPVDPVVMIGLKSQRPPGHHKLVQNLHPETVLRWDTVPISRLLRALSVGLTRAINQGPKVTWMIFRRRGELCMLPRTTSMKAKSVGGGCRTNIRRQLASLRLYAMILSGF